MIKMWAKIIGAFVIPGLVVLSAMLLFAGTAAVDDGVNGHSVGGITDESYLRSVIDIPKFATISCPLVSLLGLLLFFNHRKLKEET